MRTRSRAHPRHVVPRMTKALRTGKFPIDWSQNNGSKPPAPRTHRPPTVSVTRDEV